MAKVRRLHLPGGFRKRGQQLLEQQCWLRGQDVRHAGFWLTASTARPPQNIVGASAYQLRLSG